MNSKSVTGDFFVQRKKRKLTLSCQNVTSGKENPNSVDAESAFLELKDLFPVKELNSRLPPIILVHQVYSILKNRTAVDKEINELVEKDVLRLFKLGMNGTTIVAIFSEDFNAHVLGRICPCQVVTNAEEWQEDPQPPTINKESPVNPSTSKALTINKCHKQFLHYNKTGKKCITCLLSRTVVRFIYEVMPLIQDVSVDKEILKIKYKFSEEDIRMLMNIGLLVVRSVGSYWLSFPNAGEFMKHFLKGRAALLRLIKKCKFSEILQSELEKRQLDKTAKFGIQYHIHDLIGGDFVDCVESTSGTLLRFTTANEK